MIPVLAVDEPAAACEDFARLFGFTAAGGGRMHLGSQTVVVVAPGAAPAGMVPFALDHVALAVGDADATHAALAARGARLAPAFTPRGPKDIAEFWEHGVRFVFFEGPEGWPIEFCARNGIPTPAAGHDHYAIRTPDLDAVAERLATLGARPLASHVLVGATRPVHVRFLALGARVFEIFDEGPFASPAVKQGWIGLLPS